MDGWNEEKVEGIIGVLDDLYNLNYEIKNCVRGCYTGADTYEELQEYISHLADRLKLEAESMDICEDEEEDWEDDEDEN